LDNTPDEKLDAAIAEYFAAIDRGEAIDAVSLARRHGLPGKALDRFLTEERRVADWFGAFNSDTPPGGVIDDPRGVHIGDYRLIGELGRGGMGIVYEAEQLSLGRIVALKVLPRSPVIEEARLTRFNSEARAVARLEHPNIVPIYAAGFFGHTPCIAMKRINGEPLSRWLARKLSELDEESLKLKQDRYRFAACCAHQVAEALDHAHQRGVIHRDVKPSNLLIDVSNKVWITDFGLAKAVDGADETATGTVIGTLRYMSPEQASGDIRAVDHRTDVYSLGATLYELLALRPPYDFSESARVFASLAAGDRPLALRQLAEGIPIDLETIVDKAMRLEAHDRYGSAAELAEDLRRFIAGLPILARPATAYELLAKWLRNHTAAVTGSALALLLTILALTYGLFLLNAERLRAERALGQSKQMLYVADVHGAYDAYHNGWRHEARSLLDRHRTLGGNADPRGVEWRLLDALLPSHEEVLLGNHTGAANELAVFPGGKRVVSVGDDGFARIFATTGGKVREIEIGNEPLHSVAVSPDGRFLAVAGLSLHLCDLRSGRPPKTIVTFPYNIESLAFSPDGRTIAVTVRYHETCLIDLDGHVLARSRNDSRGESIQFTADGGLLTPNRLATASGKGLGVADIWGTPLQGSPRTLRCAPSEEPQHAITLSYAVGKDRLMVGCGYQSGAHLLNAATGEVLASSTPGRDQMTSLTVSGGQVATGFSDGAVSIHSLTDDRTTATIALQSAFRAHAGIVMSLGFIAPDRLVSCGADGRVLLWNLRLGDGSRSLPQLFGRNDNVLVSAASRDIAVLSETGLTLIDRDSATSSFIDAPNSIAAALGRHAGEYALLQDSPPILRYRSAATHTSWDAPVPPEPWCVAFAGDGETIVAAGGNRLLSLNTQSGKSLGDRRWNGIITTACGVSGGVAIGGAPPFIEIDALRGGPIRQLPCESNTTCLAASDDGQLLASGHGDSLIRLWDVASGHQRAELTGHSQWVLRVAFSADSKTLFSSSVDGTIRMWAIESERPYGMAVRLYPNRVSRPSFDLRGDNLAILLPQANGSSRLTFWDLSSRRGQ